MTDRLDPQPWMTSASARRVMQALERAHPGSARFVGGCVRNALLGEPVSDVDIATQLTPDRVEAAMKAAGIAVHPTGVEHGTLTVVADHQPYEVTTLRRDVETDGRRAVVAFSEDWAEDAQRRDFRMNALYAEADGTLHDPTGGGLEDIAARRIVFVGEPETRIREDYLRILRFFRFNAWYGRTKPDAAGLKACGELKAGLSGISAERIWMELKKLLGAPEPMDAINAMEASGVLETVLPEMVGQGMLWGLVQLERNEFLKPDPMLRFLALYWDDPDAAAKAARRLKMSNEERDRLVFTARDATPITAAMSEGAMRQAIYRIGSARFGDLATLEWANDAEGDSPAWRQLVERAAAWVVPQTPVSGDDLLAAGLAAGPSVGEAMRKLEAEWVASDFTLTREALLAKLKA